MTKEVRIGLVGLGNIGKLHYGYMPKLEGAKLTAVCDIEPDRFDELTQLDDFDHELDEVQELGEDIKTFTNYKDMLKSGLIDLIIIGVPHYFHPRIAIDAMKEGIHVLSEKPVAITAREARMMNEAYAKTDDLIFSAMFQQRTVPTFKKIKELIEDGTLGELKRINWIITDWFRTQHYYNSGGWRGNWTGEGGGVLMNQCPHNLDLFQWFFGLPDKLTALTYLGKWHDITVEDDVSVIMEMENGATASFITTTGDTPGTNRLEITGENGKLVYEKGKKLKFYKTGEPVQEILDTSDQGFYHANPEEITIEVKDEPHGHQYVTQNLVDVIRGKLDKSDLISPGTDGINALQLANAMLYTGLKGEKVDFPVSEAKFDALLEELREDERKNHPDKVFDWEEFLQEKGL